MKHSLLKSATYSACITALTFWLFFQLSKIRVLQNVSPFAEDPYDAVASFAFQIAAAIALLSLARMVNIRNEEDMQMRAPFILRGILLVEVCVFVPLITNLAAIINALPLALSTSMLYLLGGMTFLTLLCLMTGILWFRAKNETGNLPVQPRHDALGQTIRDCWNLITVISTWIVARLPVLKPLWNRIDSLAHTVARVWNKQLRFANPNQHPWGFAMAFAILTGFMVMGFIMLSESVFEGGPENLAIAFLLAGIFFAGETMAVFLSFLVLGGYLGLRPRL